MNAIIGTAGHVDHGKTSLIKALTGIDTDRLSEEKKRGITIELGFAHLTMPTGQQVGIVDVPGHEKFIRNMLAGAGSIDIALLVVAADEGIMPQTREHLDILRMLKIKRGVIAINKSDLVDNEWLEIMAMEIEEEMCGTFLHSAKIIPVSATTGAGVEELRLHMFDLLADTVEKSSTSFRMPVDRVFTMDGFGTVVTGTLIDGELNEGDDIEIYPSGVITKARRLQVFGKLTQKAMPGQRVAINLSQVKMDDITRGNVLAPPTALENTHLLEVRLDILPNHTREVLSNCRVHLYHGTRDILCRISLLEVAALKPGESGYAKLHLAEPLAAKNGDPFVIRFYSPLETIGGGVILDPIPQKSRNNKDTAHRIATKDTGSLTERIAAYVEERPFAEVSYIAEKFIYPMFDLNRQSFDSALTNLAADGIIFIMGSRMVHSSYIMQKSKLLQAILKGYHEKNSLHKGMPISEVRGQIFTTTELPHADDILEICHTLGYINKNADTVSHKNFSVTINQRQQAIRTEILQVFESSGFSPPGVYEIEAAYAKEKKTCRQVLQSLVECGELILLTPQIFIHANSFEQAKDIFLNAVAGGGEVTLAQFRDKAGTSRKYAMAILECFDKLKISKKVGDTRIGF